MEVHRDLPTVLHSDVLRQKVVQCVEQPFAGDGVPGFQADAVLIGMHPGIRAAAPLDLGLLGGNLEKRLLKHLLHRDRIVLNLPTVVLCAVVTERQ